MYDFILEQIGYSGSALSPAQIDMIILSVCVFLVVAFGVLAIYLLCEVLRWIIGRCKG